jgi:small basic protein
MNFDISFISANALVIVPIVIAIVEAFKLTGKIPDHFSPLLSIVVGILIGFLADHDNPELSHTLLSGVVYGLMASGLYSGIRTTMQARQQQKIRQQQNKRNNQQ